MSAHRPARWSPRHRPAPLKPRRDDGILSRACKSAYVRAVICLSLLILLAPATVVAVPYSISVDTSRISGASAQLALDFIDGGPPANMVTVSDFLTNGTLGPSLPLIGGASGSVQGIVTLSDLDFFNEYATNITLGSRFSFVLTTSTNAPDPSSIPDTFSLFVLKPTTGLSLFPTTDPTGSDALLALSIDGGPQGALNTFSAPGGEAVVTVRAIISVPEPSTLILIGTSLGFIYVRRNRRRVVYGSP